MPPLGGYYDVSLPTASPKRNAVEPVKEVDPNLPVSRDHNWLQYAIVMSSLSLCITVDILQYSVPLAFLPSVLEDRGHETVDIATAIGIYYWAGFLGGLCVTGYELWKAFYVKEEHGEHVTSISTAQRHVKFLIFGLGIGVVTLCIQAVNPRWMTHTVCRFIQGFAGAYIFFYVFLLNAAVFKGQQLVTAMTCASCATVLAELAGPLLGSFIYDLYGQPAVFWFLGFISFGNQLMLVAALYTLHPVEETNSPHASPMIAIKELAESPAQPEHWWSVLEPQPGAWPKMKVLLQDRTMICACLMICMAGMIKGSVEEMLPLHADHRWGYDPMQIGQLFCTVAITYMVAAAVVCQIWIPLGRFQIGFSAQSIFLLGVTSYASFCVAVYTKSTNVLHATFAAYGFAAGLAFTAAAQLIGDVIDNQDGHRKDAANGIWNTVWEAGGSSGFALGGLLAHHHTEQMALTEAFMICAIVVAVAMLALGGWGKPECSKLEEKCGKATYYGSTA